MPDSMLIILHPTFYDYISFIYNGQQEIPTQVLQNDLKLTPVSLDKNFKMRYLLGDANFEGIIKKYHSRFQNVGIVDENYFKTHFDELLMDYDVFDFQFAGNISTFYIRQLEEKKKLFHGWATPQLGGKHVQVQHFSQISGFKSYIPLQLFFSDLSSLQEHDPDAIVDYFPSEFLIVKSFYSSKSRMNDGTGYPIFNKKNWSLFVEYAARHPTWFEGKNGIIISELIEIESARNQIFDTSVHKVHLPTSLDIELTRYDLGCQIINGRIHLNRVSNGIRQFNEIYELLSYGVGNLNDYKAILITFCNSFFPYPCLFGIDLMIMSDGTPKFLEINKLAGTFAEIYSVGYQSPLETYINLVLEKIF